MAAQAIASATSYKNPKLIGIQDVEIDKSGKFKYILIKVHDPDKDREFKFIVRGTSKAGYHGSKSSTAVRNKGQHKASVKSDIYEMVVGDIEAKGLDCEVLGGGRIEHEPNKKAIKIYGYSQQYGRADHSITQTLLLRKFKDYESVTWSNEGY